MLRILAVLLMVTMDVAVATSITSVSELLKAAEFQRVKNPAKVAEYVSELELRQRELTHEERQRLRILTAHQKAIKGNLDEAIVDIVELNKSEMPADVRSRANALIAQLYLAKAEYIEAFSALENALKAIHKTATPEVRVDVLEVAARLFAAAGEYDKAKQYSVEAITLARSIDDPMRHCFSWAGLVEAEKGKEDNRSIEKSARQMLAACEGISELHVGLTLINLGEVLTSENKTAEAEAALKKSEAILKERDYRPGLASLNLVKAKLLIANGNYQGALALLQSARSTSAELGMSDDHAAALEQLAKVSAAQEQWQESSNYYQQLRIIEKTNLDRETRINKSFLQVQFESQLRDYELDKLAQEKSTLSYTHQQLEQQQRILIGALVLLALGLAGVGLLLRRMQRQQRKLRELAAIDPLTGIANRRQAFKLAERLLASCQRRGAPFATIMLDLDHFKAVNDRYGHAIGDQLLCHAAHALELAVRRQDVVGRAGGEEFVIFLPDTGLDAAALVAERCRLAITAEATERNISCTASLGLAVASYGLQSLDQLMAQADAALYRAKQQGRNRVVTAALTTVSAAATV